MVLFFFCRSFFTPQGEKMTDKREEIVLGKYILDSGGAGAASPRHTPTDV
jgi:hypothetical protein